MVFVLRHHGRKPNKTGSACSDSTGREGSHSEHAEPRSAHHSRCKPAV